MNPVTPTQKAITDSTNTVNNAMYNLLIITKIKNPTP